MVKLKDLGFQVVRNLEWPHFQEELLLLELGTYHVLFATFKSNAYMQYCKYIGIESVQEEHYSQLDPTTRL